MKFGVLLACGPNSIEIPCRIFSSYENGVEKCTTLFGKPARIRTVPKGMSWMFKEELEDLVFTHYNGGCGECGFLALVEVEEDSKFICFDLD